MVKKLIPFTFLLITFQSFSQDSLKLHLPFNSNSLDASANSNDAIIFGATLAFDRFGNENSAYNFDGQLSHMVVPHSPELDFNVAEEFTISLWIYPRSFNFSMEVFSKWINDPGSNNANYPYSIRLDNRAPNFNKVWVLRYDKFCAGIPNTYSTNPVMIDNWNHVVFRKLGDSLSIFLNGTKDSEIHDFSQCNTSNSDPIFIGKRGGSANPNFFDGIIDDIKLFNTGLSEDLIDSLYNENPNINALNFNDKENKVAIFPNPAKNFLVIESLSTEQIERVLIIDAIGQIVMEKAHDSGRINTSNLQRGFYNLRIISTKEEINRKIILD